MFSAEKRRRSSEECFFGESWKEKKGDLDALDLLQGIDKNAGDFGLEFLVGNWDNP